MFFTRWHSGVTLRIFGGLGNQLFAYAAARRLALVSNAQLVIDHVSGFRYDSQYQRHYQLEHFAIPCRKATAAERLEPFSRIRRNLLRRWNARCPFEQRSYIQQLGIDFDPRLLTLRLSGTLYLEGYWQSESYFKDVEPQIREDLRIIPPKDDANQQMAARIQNQVAVAVHVRFFDEPEQSSPSQFSANNAPNDYYQRAIAEMEQRVPGGHYFLFSDRPEAALARIPLPDDRITLVHHNQGDAMAYADLWLMTLCQHFIIANSTFSWWGAWLSENPNKVVIAPGFEKRVGSSSWGFRGLLPTDWIKV
jgi:hypothetical protein